MYYVAYRNQGKPCRTVDFMRLTVEGKSEKDCRRKAIAIAKEDERAENFCDGYITGHRTRICKVLTE